MKGQLLALLQSGAYISGEEMSRKLGVSRTAVWKKLSALREQGYELESAPKKGYRLLSSPDTLLAHDIEAHLQTKTLGRNIHSYDSVASTQPLAHEEAAREAREGTLIVANEQQGARGRLGRQWQSTKGTSLSMSLLLRPDISVNQAPQLTLLAAVAVTRAIEAVSGLVCDIKWPNDILYGGKKLVGILTEMAADPDRVNYCIVGIGINCNQESNDFAETLAGIATSIKLETGNPVQRAKLVAAVMNEFEWLYDEYIKNGFAAIRPLWEARSVSLHTKLSARTPSRIVQGYSLGITDDGRLRIQDEDGQEHLIYSADIELDN